MKTKKGIIILTIINIFIIVITALGGASGGRTTNAYLPFITSALLELYLLFIFTYGLSKKNFPLIFVAFICFFVTPYIMSAVGLFSPYLLNILF